jgi:hypothetical protein
MVLLHPGVDRKACLSNVDLTTLAADITDFLYPQSQVVLEWPKVTIGFPRQEANRLDAPVQRDSNSIDGRDDKARR